MAMRKSNMKMHGLIHTRFSKMMAKKAVLAAWKNVHSRKGKTVPFWQYDWGLQNKGTWGIPGKFLIPNPVFVGKQITGVNSLFSHCSCDKCIVVLVQEMWRLHKGAGINNRNEQKSCGLLGLLPDTSKMLCMIRYLEPVRGLSWSWCAIPHLLAQLIWQDPTHKRNGPELPWGRTSWEYRVWAILIHQKMGKKAVLAANGWPWKRLALWILVL